MAILYVDDDGSDTSPYDNWAKAANNISDALSDTACVAGSTVYIQSDYVDVATTDQTFLATYGTISNPIRIISVNTLSVPESSDYESMMDGGGNFDCATNGRDINLTGQSIWMGCKFSSGDDLRFYADGGNLICIDCEFNVADYIYGTSGDNHSIEWYNCNLIQTTAGDIRPRGRFIWKGGRYSFSGGSTTNLFTLGAVQGSIQISDVDFQDLDSGDYLVSSTDHSWDVIFTRCKIPAATNYMDTGPTSPACQVKFHSVDDGNNIHTFKEFYFTGQIESETAVVRSATYNGIDKYSAKLVAAKGNTVAWSRPLRFKLAEIYCAANPTLEMHFNLDDANVIQNDELWFEVEYPDATTGALGKIDTSSRPANILTTAADQGSSEGDPGGWTESFTNPQARGKSVTISGGQAGVHTVWACLAKEATVYVCPKIEVS